MLRSFFHTISASKPRFINAAVVVIALTLALFALRPFFPLASLYISKLFYPHEFSEEYYHEKYTSSDDTLEGHKILLTKETNNRIIIPSIGVDIETYRDLNEHEALAKGAWVVPGSVKPGETGEMVITGHRFEILPPAKNTFYNLDKLKEGDVFYVIEDNYFYTYTITKTEIVKPEDYMLGQKDIDMHEAVLYTCTPLWTAAKRLLHFGELVSVQEI